MILPATSTNTGAACGSGGGSGTVNSGSTGQIAYYNGNGAAVSGMSAVPVSAGGTGATTAAGAIAALNGVSLAATTAQSFAGPLNASVNTQFNVMAYGAKGDCVTDDTAAFNAAQTAAIGYAVGNSLPAALFLPKPPVCYLLDHWGWQGVSLEGQPSGLGPASPQQYGVTICGKPGHDIIHIPDPATTTTAVKVYPGWSIRNVGFRLDNSAPFDTTVGYTNAHRWFGRWFDDGAMTGGSAVFKTTNGNITCGDVGQYIQVNGAGSGGANLVTTIASVTPCWAYGPSMTWQTVTLATAASTTVTNAHSYVSVLGLTVTTNVGNCAIAFDMKDGNPSDWTSSSYSVGAYPKLENVVFNTYGNSYYPCGIFAQGGPILYGMDARNIGLYYNFAGIVQTSTELNSSLQPSSGDFERWDHVAALYGYTPWISDNGLAQQLTHWQVTSNAGLQVLTLGNQTGDYPVGWRIDHGMECPSGPCTYGDHITGSQQDMTISATSGASGQTGYLDTSASKCWSCYLTNTFVDGYKNDVRNTNGGSTNVVNQGLDNTLTTGYVPSPYGGIPPNYESSNGPYKGANNIAGRYTPDFLVAGNYQTPYNNDDLFIWPNDLEFSSTTAWSSIVVPDSTSPTGYHMVLTSNATYTKFNQVASRTGAASMVVGTTVPSTGATLYLMAKCPSGTTTFTPVIETNLAVSYSAPTLSCSTAYAYYAINVTWQSGDIGGNVQIGAANGSNTFYAAWMDVVPFTAPVQYATAANQVPLSGVLQAASPGVAEPGTYAYNSSMSVIGGGTSLPSTIATTSTTNDAVCFSNTAFGLKDCGTAPGGNVSGSGTTGYIPLWSGASAQGNSPLDFGISFSNTVGYKQTTQAAQMTLQSTLATNQGGAMVTLNKGASSALAGLILQDGSSYKFRVALNTDDNLHLRNDSTSHDDINCNLASDICTFYATPSVPGIVPGTIYTAAGTPLPPCGAAIKGEQAVVGDATSPTYMGAYASGGAITAAVICSYNGTTYSWLTH